MIITEKDIQSWSMENELSRNGVTFKPEHKATFTLMDETEITGTITEYSLTKISKDIINLKMNIVTPEHMEINVDVNWEATTEFIKNMNILYSTKKITNWKEIIQ